MTLIWSMGIVIVLAIFLKLVEGYGLGNFWPNLFRTGLPVYRYPLPLAVPDLPKGSVFETQSGRFKVITPRECLFYNKSIAGFDDGRWTLNGRLLWTEGHALAEGQIPITSILSRIGWMIFMGVALAVSSALPLRNWTIGVAVALLVLAILSFIFYRRTLAMKDTAHRILVEYEVYMADRRDGNQTNSPKPEARR